MVMAPIDRFPRPLPRPLPQSQDALVDRMVHQMLDGNGDDAVSQEEWKQAGWTADRFKAFDGDGDGKVTQREFLQARRYEREFNAKDRNGDGELSRSEFNGFHRLQLGLKAKVGDVLGGAKHLGEGFIRHLPFPGFKDRFARYDADNDGQVSKAEYMAGRRKEETLIKPTPWPIPRPVPMPLPFRPEDVLKADVKAEKQ